MKPKPHDCRRNWSGSTKAMEADSCVETLKVVNKSGQGVKIGVIIGDDDSSAIHHVWARVSKWSAQKSPWQQTVRAREESSPADKESDKVRPEEFHLCHESEKGNPDGLTRKAFFSTLPHMYGNTPAADHGAGHTQTQNTPTTTYRVVLFFFV